MSIRLRRLVPRRLLPFFDLLANLGCMTALVPLDCLECPMRIAVRDPRPSLLGSCRGQGSRSKRRPVRLRARKLVTTTPHESRQGQGHRGRRSVRRGAARSTAGVLNAPPRRLDGFVPSRERRLRLAQPGKRHPPILFGHPLFPSAKLEQRFEWICCHGAGPENSRRRRLVQRVLRHESGRPCASPTYVWRTIRPGQRGRSTPGN